MDRNSEMELEAIPALSQKTISIGKLGEEINEEDKVHEDTVMLKSKEELGSVINVSINVSEKH